jgi:glyoxalase family protein
MTIQGLHHITLVCSNAQRTVDFYARTLGQRLVKKTVNYDDPYSYHLYFGDAIGRPGTAVTFFEWAGAPVGQPGIGGTQHLALTAPNYAALLKWKRRLADAGVPVTGPIDQGPFFSIYFSDPDGVALEVATPVQEGTESSQSDRLDSAEESRVAAETWPQPVPEVTPDMALERGMHHITAISSNLRRTDAFLGELLGLPRVRLSANPGEGYWRAGVGNWLTYLERDPKREPRRRLGPGQTHHFALAVPDEETQLDWRERLVSAGLQVTPVIDRVYFKSIYTHDPDGHIVELATLGPGFLVDEPETELGRHLTLPPWLEQSRSEIERRLRPVGAVDWRTPINDVETEVTHG